MPLSTRLEQAQKMQLSPTQIQLIKMIELPTTELRQRINEELIENPMLEEGIDELEKDITPEENNYNQEDDCSDIYGEETGEDPLQNDDFDYNQYVEDDELPDYREKTNNYSPDDNYEQAPVVAGTTFHDYLLEQVGLLPLTDEEAEIATYIVGNLDNKGFLTRTTEQMVDDLAFYFGINVNDNLMEAMVEKIRHLDPPGVASRNLRECLLFQLRNKPTTPAVELAITLVDKFLEDVERHHYERLQKRLNISEDNIKQAIKVIISCNATPSSSFSGDKYETQRTQIIPDFRVETYNDEITVSLCDQDIPPLRLNKEYIDLLNQMQSLPSKKTADNRAGIRFIRQRMESAKWFIDAIRQRNETLLKTMQAIVVFQHDYFLEGDDCYLRPMILEDIAQMTGFDPSTISRVSNSKYVQTDFGIIPLKHFFSESLTNNEGTAVSSREVKKVLRELIDNEDKRHPLNDDKLVALLTAEGYVIARRTIAKYREQLGIPVAGQRKKLSK